MKAHALHTAAAISVIRSLLWHALQGSSSNAQGTAVRDLVKLSETNTLLSLHLPLPPNSATDQADAVLHKAWCQVCKYAAAASLLILWVPARLLHGRLLILGLPLGWKLALWRALCRRLLVLLELGLPLGRAAARWRLLVLLRRGAAWWHLVRRRLPCACKLQHQHSFLNRPCALCKRHM